ncbi:hypothetical protein FRC04_012183 [Tulasnella sp. 424]|nr:hypothetical protein FRC04_012183 [Tulasnella sp. 424]
MIQERWKSDESHIPKLKVIYRIDLPGQVYRRFDLALQMNEDCLVRTSYYGGIAACSIAHDSNPTPCTSESCGLCDALRTSFGNLPHGASCSDGDYGPGLYTYSNPALAYHAAVPRDDLQPQGSHFALVQCRVVARADSVPSSSAYAGFIDDSGVVFCAQSTAIIPTHVLICSAPSTNTQGKHQPSTDPAIPGLLQPDTTIAPKEKDNCTGRPVSTSYEPNHGGPQKDTRRSSYPWAGHANDDADPDGELRSSAHKYVKRSRDLQSRMEEEEEEEEEEDFSPLKPDEHLTKRMEQHDRDDEEDEDDEDDRPDHPPGPPMPPPKRQPRPILFYEETEKYYEFTNSAPYPVHFRGKKYPTSEHLFQARKFLDHRPLLAEHIRRGSDRPRFAFKEARRLAPEIRPDWKEKCIEIMDEIMELKFTQHNKLRRLLLDTGERYLILNAGKYDDFWGNGADGNGRNELGKALMRIRTSLREREKEALTYSLTYSKGTGKLRRMNPSSITPLPS